MKKTEAIILLLERSLAALLSSLMNEFVPGTWEIGKQVQKQIYFTKKHLEGYAKSEFQDISTVHFLFYFI